VAAVRLAVRRSLTSLPPGALVLAACSGGPDSLALAAALAFEAPRLGLRGGGITVDHGLQPGSADQARRVTAIMTELGLDPACAVAVTVPAPGGPAPYAGPEGAARAARYAALAAACAASGAAAVLLGHTRDDQAETVLLGLARGSGARSLAGMAPVTEMLASPGDADPSRTGQEKKNAASADPDRADAADAAPNPIRYLRPLLDISRAQSAVACAAAGLEPWHDPHNHDPGYARVRVRDRLLPAFEAELGPGIAAALARTARQLRADADALDELAAAAAAGLADGRAGRPPAGLAARAPARRQAALAAGAPAGALAEGHIAELDALVTGDAGGGGVDLPGGVRGRRRYGRLLFATATKTEGACGRE
jgi:tRNA(Ile)-lysidine synthase